jgi:hypothetical protein
MNAASGGTKTKLGTWTGAGEPGAGTGTNAGYFRMWDSAITHCEIQGTITVTGGGGDLTIDNVNIASGQSVSTATFTVTAGNP